MLKKLLSIGMISALALASAQMRADAIKMVFNDTDVSTILRAISERTHTTIVYVNKDKVPITVSITADTVDQAVKIVAATAGLSYRKAGSTYVVATADTMRKAIEPFSYKVTFTLEPGAAARVAGPLQNDLPDATVRVVGDKIVFTGLLEDVEDARTFIETMRASETREKPVADVMVLSSANPTYVSKLLTTMVPNVKVTPSGDDTSVGGMIGISGSVQDVASAKQLATNVDVQSGSGGPNPIITDVYTLRYTNGPQAKAFLSNAMPAVEVYVSPESYSPQRARFSPLVGALSSSGGGGGGFSNLQSAGQQQQQPTQTDQQIQVKTGETGSISFGLRSKSIVLKGHRSQVDEAFVLLKRVDTKPKQIVVEVNVIEMPTTNDSKTGIDWNWSPLDFTELPAGSHIADNPNGNAWTNDITTRPGGLGAFSRVPFNFRAIINAMVKKSEAKILAKPSISVIDNDTASVFVGDTIRVPVPSAGALGAETLTIEEFPIGIILLIAPRVNADGNITLHVNPVVSSVTDIVNGLPQTSAREADTTLIAKDGETIVIGGLISNEERKAVSEIPFLSKLPLIGELFRPRNNPRHKTEIVVSLTPHILVDNETEAK